jgi:hypothetical protein
MLLQISHRGRPITPHLVANPIDNNHLPIEGIKRANTKIAVA